MKIQICKKFSKVNKLQKKLTQAFPNDTVVIKKFIDMCKVCKDQPTVKVQKKEFKSKLISSLISKLKTL